MKRQTLKHLFTGAIGLSTIAVLAACTSKSQSFIDKVNNELAFTSTTGLAGIDSNTKTVKALKRYANQTNEQEDTDFINIIESADLILSNGTGFSIIEHKSNKEGYETLNIVSFKDYDGKEYSYSLYYNDVNSKTTTDEDETETKVSYQGLAVLDDLEYQFDFESKLEVEEDEEEFETKLTIYTGQNSKIVIKSENETEADEVEQSFSYKIIENGKNTSSYSLSVEKENNHQSVKIKYNGTKLKVDETIKEGKNVIRIVSNESTKFYERVKNENGTYSYTLIK